MRFPLLPDCPNRWMPSAVTALLVAGCGSGSTESNNGSTGPTPSGQFQMSTPDGGNNGGSGGSSGGGSSGIGASSGSAEPADDAATGDGSEGDGGSAGDDGGSPEDDGGSSEGGSGSSGGGSASSGSSGSSGSSSGSTSCVTGQTTDQEVVMLGDSYMDYANVGPTIMQDAGNRMFRHYYLAGAAMNYGALNLNIPYQFDTSALMDTSVTNPTDIKVVIMDGGGNDILIDNSQCLTTPVAGDTTCHTAIQGTLTRAQQLLQDESSKGAQHIVYYFYPDLDPNVSGHQYAGAWVDYAYPLAAAMCCGSANVPASGDLSCHGNVTSTTDCTWVDTRPLFVGHNNSADPSTYWFMSDNIHPTQPGATAIAAKVWAAMQQYCVAQ
jgi:hypothetical protein